MNFKIFLNFYQKFIFLLKNPKLYPIRNVFYFILLLLTVHFSYIWWSHSGYFPIKNAIDYIFKYSSRFLFYPSVWILNHVFSFDFTTHEQTIWISTKLGDLGYVEVSPGCTSLKQWIHWIIIMTFFPGPLFHKVWYIPLGILVIHTINILRIVGLSLVVYFLPHKFEFFHDYIFKTLFYATIFAMWVIWVEYFVEQRPNCSPNCKG